MKETIVKNNKTFVVKCLLLFLSFFFNKSRFFEKINKIDKPLTRLIKKKDRRIKSRKLEMKKES